MQSRTRIQTQYMSPNRNPLTGEVCGGDSFAITPSFNFNQSANSKYEEESCNLQSEVGRNTHSAAGTERQTGGPGFPREVALPLPNITETQS